MVLSYGRRRANKVNRGNEKCLNKNGCPSKIGKPVLLNNYIARRAPGQRTMSNPYKVAYDILVNYFNKKYNYKYSVDLMGEKETLTTDLGVDLATALEANGNNVIHVTNDSTEYKQAPLHVQQAVDLWNGLKIKGEISKKVPPVMVAHVIALVTKEDETALKAANFGVVVVNNSNNQLVIIKAWASIYTHSVSVRIKMRLTFLEAKMKMIATLVENVSKEVAEKIVEDLVEVWAAITTQTDGKR